MAPPLFLAVMLSFSFAVATTPQRRIESTASQSCACQLLPR
jgi:hypothetical protein